MHSVPLNAVLQSVFFRLSNSELSGAAVFCSLFGREMADSGAAADRKTTNFEGWLPDNLPP